jgi:spermidine synthase
LDPAVPRDKVWAEVLEWLQQNRRPAYVEIDPDTHHITSLLLPQPFRVRGIRQVGRDLRVELEVSHAVHYVRANLPGFDQIAARLRAALAQEEEVLVTQSLDTSAIIDVHSLLTP